MHKETYRKFFYLCQKIDPHGNQIRAKAGEYPAAL